MMPERFLPRRAGQLVLRVGDDDGGIDVKTQLAAEIWGCSSRPRRGSGFSSTGAQQREMVG